MNAVYLEIGGNQGDRISLLKKARTLIKHKIGKIKSRSSIYETPPWGFDDDQDFLNQVVLIETNKSAHEILDKINEIENELGRVRQENRYVSRTMDIDILFYGNEIIESPDIQIPHPRIHLRKFVLIPLQELNKNLVHPGFKKTIDELLSDCEDTSECKKVKAG